MATPKALGKPSRDRFVSPATCRRGCRSRLQVAVPDSGNLIAFRPSLYPNSHDQITAARLRAFLQDPS